MNSRSTLRTAFEAFRKVILITDCTGIPSSRASGVAGAARPQVPERNRWSRGPEPGKHRGVDLGEPEARASGTRARGSAARILPARLRVRRELSWNSKEI